MTADYIDTHAHLDQPEFAPVLDSVLENARNAGVLWILSTATSVVSTRRSLELAERFPDIIRATAGIHPNHCAGHSGSDLEGLEALALQPGITAIGETGLDFHRDFSDRRDQEHFFRRHIELAAGLGKPLIIHGRKADREILEILDNYPLPLSGIRHCFDGTAAMASEYVARGLHIAFGGLITRGGYRKLKDAVRAVPDNRLLLETDSPYLTPQGAGGGRNEPAYVRYVARAMAGLREESEEHIAALTSANAARLLSC